MSEREKSLAALGSWTIDTYSQNLVNFGRGPAIPCGDMHQTFTDTLATIMVALRSRCGHYILPCSLFFFSSPNLSRRRLDIYHTSTHGVALV